MPERSSEYPIRPSKDEYGRNCCLQPKPTPSASVPYVPPTCELSSDEINFLLDLAKRLELNPEPSALKGKVLGLLFLNPSLRTMTSFQSAMIRLGGGSFVVSPDMSIHGLETRDGVIMDGKSAEHINPRSIHMRG